MNWKKTKEIRKKDRKVQNEDGALIMEAAFVYPIMFFIVAFLIYMGNMYYLKARIHAVVALEATHYAALFADPLLDDIEESESVPTSTKDAVNVTDELYRYINIFSNGEADQDTKDALEANIAKTGYFAHMTPVNIEVDVHKVHNYVVYQTYEVEVSYELRFPIKFIFQEDYIHLSMMTREETPIVDTPEFIRNVDWAIDILQRTEQYGKISEKYTELYNKIKEYVTKGAGESSGEGTDTGTTDD